jgi:AraC-like DNA-binding protein
MQARQPVDATARAPRPHRILSRRAFADLCRARARLQSARPLRLRQLAATALLSPFQFIRRFNALFGETPHQLRIRARIDLARTLLALTERAVTDVCFDVGFSSLGSFSALFKRRTGMSPSAYRAHVRAIGSREAVRAAVAPGCLTLMGEAFAILEKREADQAVDTESGAATDLIAARGRPCASS